MKKIFAILMVVSVLGVVIGCGEKPAEEPAPATTATTAGAETK